ncbi:hypothetical protein [Bifidobacterium callimiconis]|uniref:Uncharacterized protein n=1 Tax=Bifidobacterium callimiconis TaxID=2306973 RepID=A0A430FBK7_9BIFI|nr:hypothetical protein [Bifidobacterium callimiconis]RSX50217.1 hypothetical protein D2E23_1765 [Bifidobacterium callimiconis]
MAIPTEQSGSRSGSNFTSTPVEPDEPIEPVASADHEPEDESGDDAESTSTKAVYQLSVVSIVLGIGAMIACFIPGVSLTYALFAAIGGAVLGLVDCLSATVLHEPKVRLIAACSTLICALAIVVVLVL